MLEMRDYSLFPSIGKDKWNDQIKISHTLGRDVNRRSVKHELIPAGVICPGVSLARLPRSLASDWLLRLDTDQHNFPTPGHREAQSLQHRLWCTIAAGEMLHVTLS